MRGIDDDDVLVFLSSALKNMIISFIHDYSKSILLSAAAASDVDKK